MFFFEPPMVYIIEFVGGPEDGATAFCVRPYEAMKLRNEHVYRAKEPAPDCLEWVNDETRRIVLYYAGQNAPFP